jgi:hypothetical protein
VNAVLRLTHELVMHRKELWKQDTVRDMARAALAEHDRLRIRVAELERHNKRLQDPRDRVMTELA